MSVRLTLNNDRIRRYLASIGYEAPLERLHLLGIRSASPVGSETIELHEERSNQYDDTLCVFGSGFALFPATVDPGRTWTRKPSNPRGAAHLKFGAYDYQRGLHRGKPALVQAGPVTVWRDTDRDGTLDPGDFQADRGWFGINLHRGGSRPTVDSWSAGCQVIPAGHWNRFWNLIEQSGQSRFKYYLIDGNGLRRLGDKPG